MTRFLHTSDWQLGITRRFLGEAAQARYTDDRFRAVGRMGELAERTGCAFMVVCGDVFEANQIERQTVLRALEALKTVPVPVYLLPGNHDPLNAVSVLRSAAFREKAPANVHVLESAEPICAAAGVELVPAPWFSKRPVEDLLAAAVDAVEPEAGVLRIAVAHGAVDLFSPDSRNPALIGVAAAERALTEGRVHYVALGDRHSVTEVGSTGRIRYSGTPEATAHDEGDPGYALVVDLAESACRVEAHRIGSWRFVSEGHTLGGEADVRLLARRFEDSPQKDRTALRLTLRGSLSLRAKAELDRVLEEARDLFAAIEVKEPESDLVVRPDEIDADELGLNAYARSALERLVALGEGSGEEARTARDALGLLYRLALRPE